MISALGTQSGKLKKYVKLDILINNARGFYDQGSTPLTQTFEYTLQAFETNLFGTWRMVKTFVELIEKSNNGIIVNVSSGAGSFGDPDFHPGSNK